MFALFQLTLNATLAITSSVSLAQKIEASDEEVTQISSEPVCAVVELYREEGAFFGYEVLGGERITLTEALEQPAAIVERDGRFVRLQLQGDRLVWINAFNINMTAPSGCIDYMPDNYIICTVSTLATRGSSACQTPD